MKRIPWDVRIVAILLVLIGGFACYAMYFAPDSMIPGFMASTPATQLAEMSGARSLAQAVLLAWALASGQARWLRAAFCMRLITEALDLFSGLRLGVLSGGEIGFFAVVLAAEAWCIYRLGHVPTGQV